MSASFTSTVANTYGSRLMPDQIYRTIQQPYFIENQNGNAVVNGNIFVDGSVSASEVVTQGNADVNGRSIDIIQRNSAGEIVADWVTFAPQSTIGGLFPSTLHMNHYFNGQYDPNTSDILQIDPTSSPPFITIPTYTPNVNQAIVQNLVVSSINSYAQNPGAVRAGFTTMVPPATTVSVLNSNIQASTIVTVQQFGSYAVGQIPSNFAVNNVPGTGFVIQANSNVAVNTGLAWYVAKW